jgi:hypothetical protein
MIQNELITKTSIAAIGEEVGYELGAQMVKDYQLANPNDVQSYVIGRDIIDQILAQPGCVGIQFYNAYNEAGEKTLVYIGLDANGKSIFEFSCINSQGKLSIEKGIVADRVFRPSTSPSLDTEGDDWGWTID